MFSQSGYPRFDPVAPAPATGDGMYMIDEIVRPSGPRDVRLTDFYFKVDHRKGAAVHERYWVIETARPTRTIGAAVADYRFEYLVSVWRSNGWVEVLRVAEVHAETAMIAAGIAEAILGA